MLNQFSENTIIELAYYVYCLLDPEDNKIFYIGKGIGNRVFQHAKGVMADNAQTEKLETIKRIHNSGRQVKYYILIHGLKTNEIAFQFESFLIEFLHYKDFLEFSKLHNLQRGHHSFLNGINSVEEIESIYGAVPKDISYFTDSGKKMVIININKTKHFDISLYEATRKSWHMSERRAKKAEYVLSEYKGVIRAIFKPHIWLHEEGNIKRLLFEGELVEDHNINHQFLNVKIDKKRGAQNPIRYINC